MRMTVDILQHGEISITPAQEREYKLHGLRIPMIENLGIIGDCYECLNLSNNSLVSLSGFPKFELLQTLILSNNQIRRIQVNLGAYIPNLSNLILLNNQITSLSTLEALSDIPNLRRLALNGCPVTKERGYRHFVIAHCPRLQMLDFQKVDANERKEAEHVFQKKNYSKKQ
jgi:U2 small nuclear ribonucleoprotein A'